MSHSKLFTERKTTKRQLENEIINAAVHCHDIACDCNNPLTHIFQIGLRQGCTFDLPEEIRKQCLHTTTEEKDSTKENGSLVPEDGFDQGDLEELFAAGEDETG